MTFKRSECLISLKSRFNVRSKQQQLIDYGYGFTPKKQKQKIVILNARNDTNAPLNKLIHYQKDLERLKII